MLFPLAALSGVQGSGPPDSHVIVTAAVDDDNEGSSRQQQRGQGKRGRLGPGWVYRQVAGTICAAGSLPPV